MGDPGTNDWAQEASDLLIKHWQEGTTLEELPSSVRPSDIKGGYEIQRHIERLTSKTLFGWKIAATSTAGQCHINVDRPLAGRILAERVSKHGEPVPLGPNRMMVAELEFAFRMGKNLPSRGKPYEIDEVIDAVDGLFLGVEMPDSRFSEFTSAGAPQLIADNACADRWVLGPEVTVDWRKRDLSAHVVTGKLADGSLRAGNGSAVLGDPRIALTWLANELNTYDMMLEKGQYITTGTCIFPMPVKPGDTVSGDYGDFGSIDISFVE